MIQKHDMLSIMSHCSLMHAHTVYMLVHFITCS